MSRAFVSAILVVSISLNGCLASAKRPDFIDDDMLDMIKNDKTECMKAHGTTEDMIDKAGNGEIPNDRRITCYMSCLLTRMSMMDDNGVLDTDMLLSFFPDDIRAKAEAVAAKCAHMDGADNCEKIYKSSRCLYENSPELWFMV